MNSREKLERVFALASFANQKIREFFGANQIYGEQHQADLDAVEWFYGHVYLANYRDFDLCTDGFVTFVKAPAGLGFLTPDQADLLADKIKGLATSARRLNKELQG